MVSRLQELAVSDSRKLTSAQIDAGKKALVRYLNTKLLKVNQAQEDEAHQVLDQVVLCDVLGLRYNILRSLEWHRESVVLGVHGAWAHGHPST